MNEPLKVRRLHEDDDRTRFSSGNIELDRFFQCYAGQNQFRHHIGSTYVAVDVQSLIHGYASIAPSELTAKTLPNATSRRLPQYPIPVLRVARLAVDKSAQGKGIGSLLLRHVFALADEMALNLGCVGIVVDAKPEAFVFYQKLGFEPLQVISGELGERPQPKPMFIALKGLR